MNTLLLNSLHDWQNFFIVTGGASASLIGLMFVSLSLGAHMVNEENASSIRTYVNPVLVHLGVVLVVSCVMLIPTHTVLSLTVLIIVCGVIGLREAIRTGIGMRRSAPDEGIEKQHWFWHFLLPMFSYGIACLAVLGLAITGEAIWLDGLALMAITLLISSIRNMWTLVLWVVQQR